MKEVNKIRAEKIKEYKKLHNVPEFNNVDDYHKWLETEKGKTYALALESIRKEAKGRGGHRAGSGRKKLYPESVAIHKRVSKDTVVLMKDFSKRTGISENEALDRLVKEGYKHYQEA